MRWNLVADHGQRRADRFLAQYRAITARALSDQPHWDLVSLLDLLLTGDEPGDIDAASAPVRGLRRNGALEVAMTDPYPGSPRAMGAAA